MNFPPLLLVFFFLIGTIALSGMKQAKLRLKKRDFKKTLRSSGKLFFYHFITHRAFSTNEEGTLSFALVTTLNFCRFFTVFFLALWYEAHHLSTVPALMQLIGFTLMLFLLYLIADYLPNKLTSKHPTKALYFLSPIASFYLLLAFPFTWILHKIYVKKGSGNQMELFNVPVSGLRQEILEILHDREMSAKLTEQDQKMIESVIRFQSKIAREVMVPRVDMFALEAHTSIREAAKLLQVEGYSRVPVYSETIDQVTGILMYRDIMSQYLLAESKKEPQMLDAAIESIVKKALFAPETKKISNLLQEFKKKQTHLAIVVDEYGGTAGIVTIEDLLEEIVGEIEDEYDAEDEELYTPLSESSWLADGRLSILDLEEQLSIRLPEEGDYDTIGGFIFHRAGAIPAKGFKIQLDDLELEVIKSNDRRIEKVKIRKKLDSHG